MTTYQELRAALYRLHRAIGSLRTRYDKDEAIRLRKELQAFVSFLAQPLDVLATAEQQAAYRDLQPACTALDAATRSVLAYIDERHERVLVDAVRNLDPLLAKVLGVRLLRRGDRRNGNSAANGYTPAEQRLNPGVANGRSDLEHSGVQGREEVTARHLDVVGLQSRTI